MSTAQSSSSMSAHSASQPLVSAPIIGGVGKQSPAQTQTQTQTQSQTQSNANATANGNGNGNRVYVHSTVPALEDSILVDPDYGISSFLPLPLPQWHLPHWNWNLPQWHLPSSPHWPSLFGPSDSGAAAAAAATRAAAENVLAARVTNAIEANPYGSGLGMYHLSLQTPQIDLDLVQTPDKYVASIEVAGIRASDVDVRVDRNTRIVRVGVVRRRNVNCDCDFTDDCNVKCHASAYGNTKPTANSVPATSTAGSAGATATATATANSDSKSAAAAVCNCDSKAKCKCNGTGKCQAIARGAHCHDCEVKGQTANAFDTETLPGCCGHCAGVTHSKGARGYSYRRSERTFGRAQRTFRAAADVDLSAIECELCNGVLTITLPRDLHGGVVGGGAGAGAGAAAAATTTRLPIRCVTAAEAKTVERNKEQWGKAIAAAAAVGADAKQRAAVLTHHITAPNDNPSVAHAQAMAGAVAVARDPRARAHLLRHHMMRADPLAAWAYHSPVAAYSAVLRDAMELARDFELVAHHVEVPKPAAPAAAAVAAAAPSASAPVHAPANGAVNGAAK